MVANICYGKQRCLFTINEEHFKDPCPPGTKKYLTVLYACGMALAYINKSNSVSIKLSSQTYLYNHLHGMEF